MTKKLDREPVRRRPEDPPVTDAGHCANCGAALLPGQGADSRYCASCTAAWSRGPAPRKYVGMSMTVSHVNVFVEDLDRAKAFYTEKLGFEVRSDATLDGFRWLTVGPKDQPDLNILLTRPQAPMFSEEDAQALLRLVAKGVMGAGVIETNDVRRAYEELKGKGVTFLQEPADRPYGIEALFRDDSGNWFSLNQHKRHGG